MRYHGPAPSGRSTAPEGPPSTLTPTPLRRSRSAPVPSATLDRFREGVRAAGGARSAARSLGCSRSLIDMIATGARKRPGLWLATRIDAAWGIPPRAWFAVQP